LGHDQLSDAILLSLKEHSFIEDFEEKATSRDQLNHHSLY
jgi:hypothetical protein